MIKIYICDNISSFSEDEYRMTYALMPQSRQEKVDNLLFNDSKVRSVIAFQLLQKGLEKDFNIHSPIDFYYNRYGNPFLINTPAVHFSLSHSDNAVLCIIGDQNVGIDVEDIRSPSVDLIKYCCNDREQHKVFTSMNSDEAFYKIWTQKESFLKMRGCGITENIKNAINNVSITFHTQMFREKGYIYSWCKED